MMTQWWLSPAPLLLLLRIGSLRPSLGDPAARRLQPMLVIERALVPGARLLLGAKLFPMVSPNIAPAPNLANA